MRSAALCVTPIWRHRVVADVLIAATALYACLPLSVAKAEMLRDETPTEQGTGSLALSPTTKFELWARDPNVITLRRLLVLAGLSPRPRANPDVYDLELLKAVRIFQERRSLTSTGIPRLQTITALNALARARHDRPSPAAGNPPPSRIASGGVAIPFPIPRPNPATDITGTLGSPSLPILDEGSVARMEAALTRLQTNQSHIQPIPVPSTQADRDVLERATSEVLTLVVSRLKAEDFLTRGHVPSDGKDPVLREALRDWQRHYGLRQTGRLDKPTLAAMNVPIAVRIRNLQASITRAKQLQPKLRGFYVIVNAADAQVQVVNGQSVVAIFPAIVGRDGRKTPEFVSAVPYLQLWPTWTAPNSIIRKDIAPRLRKDLAYLDRHHMRAMSGGRIVDAKRINWRRGPFPAIVQKPGLHNALGSIRFGMANNGRYYLHGTSQPELLQRPPNRRFLSSGCVRVANPEALALLLLQQGDPSWTLEKLHDLMRHDGSWNPGQRIMLKQAIPVVWTYLTAWTTADGHTHFRPDIYRRDRHPETKLASRD